MDEKLNNLTTEIQAPIIDFTEYFSAMDLPQDEIDKRIELAEKIKEDMEFLFVLILLYRDTQGLNNLNYMEYIEIIIQSFKNKYSVELHAIYPDFENQLNDYIDYYSRLVVTRTLENMSDPYYTSEERAYFIGANEANVVADTMMFEQAKADGKTKKKWLTMEDNRVRKDHVLKDKVVIPIESYFEFEDCIMLYPHDYLNGTENQLANCRCSIHYF